LFGATARGVARRARTIANPTNKIKTARSSEPPPPPPPPLLPGGVGAGGAGAGGAGVLTGGGKVSFFFSRNNPFSMSLTSKVPDGRNGYTPHAPSVPAELADGDKYVSNEPTSVSAAGLVESKTTRPRL